MIFPVHGFLSLSPAVFRVCVEFDPASVSAAAPRRGLDSIECDPAQAGSQWLAPGHELHFERVHGGTHDETAWAGRVAPMLRFLFPSQKS